MLTNPNTCGLFERDIVEIADAVHEAGAYFYCDGANFNAIVGKARPGDLGVDAMHINLHKTFSTPHGGGGPGAGPVVLSARLAPFAPRALRDARGRRADAGRARQRSEDAQPFGRMHAFHGQMGMFVRALAYMLSHGADGLRQASEDAVLNANYIRAGLSDLHERCRSATGPACTRRCSTTRWLKDTGVTTLDFAKAMIDEGYPPDDHVLPAGRARRDADRADGDRNRKASLDLFIATLRDLAMSREARRDGALHRRALSRAAPPAGRDRAPPATRCCAGRRRRRSAKRRSSASAAIQSTTVQLWQCRRIELKA